MTKRDIEGLDPELKRLWDAITHEREMREQLTKSNKEALGLQAEKNEKHFNELNHAHERALKAQEQTVPRGEFTIWQRGVDKQLNEYRGAINTALLIGGVLVTVLNISIALILRYVFR